MWERTCNDCGKCKPNNDFERRGNGYRNTCKLCRNLAREGKRVVRKKVAPPKVIEALPAEVNNSFALWFGPVDRERVIRPTL